MQNDVLVQDTPDRNVDVDDVGLDWTMLQVVPFHCSIRGAMLVVSTEPTATQKDVVMQDTPDRYMSVSPDTVGDVIADHVEPFQSSMFAASVLISCPLPTATHQFDVTHDTLAIPFVAFAVVLVLGIVVQFDALTVAGEE